MPNRLRKRLLRPETAPFYTVLKTGYQKGNERQRQTLWRNI